MKINQFMNRVLESKALVNKENADLIIQLLKEKVDDEQIKEWINELVSTNNESEIAHLASLMEVHPLGFQKFVIWDEKIRARIHSWDNLIEKKENIHDHRFNFCSKVICGSYIHEVYEEKNVDCEEGKVEVELVSRKELYAGDTYYFPAGVFHRIIPSKEKTVSFLVRGEAVLPYTRIIDSETMTIKKGYGSARKFIDNISKLANNL